MRPESIPVISIEELWNPVTLRALDRACREWGFFQITKHGIDESVIGTLHKAMETFFALPDREKQVISRTAENPWGYFDRELTKNKRDWKQIYDYGPGDGGLLQPQWPESLPEFPGTIRSFYRKCEVLSFSLIAAISSNLGMSREFLGRSFRPAHTSFLRLNHYPVCTSAVQQNGLSTARGGHLGINHHTDAGALTILLQDDQPGLEVFRDGGWHLVEPRRDALVVNIGDIVQVWSNDRYRASLHRVIASVGNPRFSAPFFFNPAYQTNYEPLPATVNDRRPARYRPINWGDFRALRAAGDYADQGEEIQVSHYNIRRGPEHAVHQNDFA